MIWKCFIFLIMYISGSVGFSDTLVICEGNTTEINCQTGNIRINNASYGRHDRLTCIHESMSDIHCHSSSSFNTVHALCEGKSTCAVRAKSSVFGGDPCRGTYKYLSVQYTCESPEITCPTDPPSINSSGLLYNMTGDTENSILLYSCEKNLESGNLTRMCQSNGTWSGKEPNCTEILCPLDDTYTNSSGLLSNISGNTENSTLFYHCIGSLKSGNVERQCMANGTWSGEEPNCTDAVCTMEESAVNSSGLLISMSGHTENHNLSYRCDRNVISGNLHRICQPDGTWSGEEPNCTDMCLCKCNTIPKAITENDFQHIIENLEIDAKKTSSYKRKKISAEDNRPQSQALGSLGITVLITVFGLIIIPDLPRLYNDLKMLFRRLHRC